MGLLGALFLLISFFQCFFLLLRSWSFFCLSIIYSLDLSSSPWFLSPTFNWDPCYLAAITLHLGMKQEVRLACLDKYSLLFLMSPLFSKKKQKLAVVLSFSKYRDCLDFAKNVWNLSISDKCLNIVQLYVKLKTIIGLNTKTHSRSLNLGIQP